MATISSTGIGSGLDVNSIVTQLMAVEKQPLTTLQNKAAALDSKISAFGTIKSQLSSLADAASKLALPGTWNAKAVSSSNASAVSASVTDAGNVSTAAFSVEVSQLARAQSAASSPLGAGAHVGSGTLAIQLGSWSTATPPAFTEGSAAAVSVQVASTDSLSDIAGKINAAKAGVTATVLKDASGERLLMRSSATGEAAGFRMQATDDGSDTTGVGLGSLAFDPAAGSTGMAANPVQYGRNAVATINGITVTSGTNTLADTMPGLSLTLSQLTTAPVEITASNDTASMTTAVNAFVSAYNAMNDMLNRATAYDPDTKTAAVLQGDATTTGLQNALRSMVGAISGGGALQRLSDLGIAIAKDGAGKLSVDGTKLADALKDPAAVAQFFSAPAGTSSDATTGFATRVSAFAKAAVASDGSLTGKTASLQTQKANNGKDQDRLNDRLTLTEARLRKQYAALDTTMSSLNALNTYITQQVAQWNKSTS